MRKIILRIALIIVVLCVFVKILHMILLNVIYTEIHKFGEKDEMSFASEIMGSGVDAMSKEILIKNDIVKINYKINDELIYCEWKDFENGKEYTIYVKNNCYSINKLKSFTKNFLTNMPNLIAELYEEDAVDVRLLFEIYYIIPIKYNDKLCYKISTKTENIIIDAETYLPIYSKVKTLNSDDSTENQGENFYEFKIGEVRDEDMAMPDITGFKEMRK